MEQRNEFDIVLWGATGFVGRLVAEGLAARFPDGGLRWAIGGRNQEKLEAVRSSLPTSIDIPIIVGDSHDLASLEAFVTRTKVVCSVVGPYAKYGSDLVKACVRHGTDYCDLTGEAHWIRHMIDAHQAEAERSGARIVNSCGFDSIPSDFGVFFLQQAAEQVHNAHCPQVRMRVTGMRGGFSGGTAASLVHGMEAGLRDKSVLRYMTKPYSLCPAGERDGPDSPDKVMSIKVEYDSDLDGASHAASVRMRHKAERPNAPSVLHSVLKVLAFDLLVRFHKGDSNEHRNFRHSRSVGHHRHRFGHGRDGHRRRTCQIGIQSADAGTVQQARRSNA